MNRQRAWILAVCLLILAPGGLAAASAASESGQDPASSTTGMLFRWLNFAVVIGLLGYAIRKKVLPRLRRRAEAIRTAIAAGGQARAAAQEELRNIEAKLAQLDTELAALRAAAEKEALAEAARIRDLARAECDKIRRAAQAEMEAAGRAARVELRVLAAQATVNQAESFIRAQINPTTRASLMHSFLTDLERRAH